MIKVKVKFRDNIIFIEGVGGGAMAQKRTRNIGAYWFIAGCGLLMLSLWVYAVSVRQDAMLAPATSPPPGTASSTLPGTSSGLPAAADWDHDPGPRPGAETGLDHPYIFLWIWEDNSLHAFKGVAVRQGVDEAATYNTHPRHYHLPTGDADP